ncbi:MAG: uncharacterized protein PWQ77_379 [Kosmotogales bacterium]|nr:uncharacterized protein [Kosmotogales bacterium]
MYTLAVIIGLVVLVISIRILKNLYIPFLLAITVMGIILLIPVNVYVDSLVNEITEWDFWKTIITISSIYLLSGTMNKSGDSKIFVSAMKKIFPSSRVASALIPAFMGLLPMPGGAMFSAPMVKGISEGGNVDSEDALVMNYWFRHSMEFFWPLYPAMIIISSMADIPIPSFILVMLPVGITAIVVGYLKFVKERPSLKFDKSAFIDVLKCAWPIIAVIVFVIIGVEGWLVALIASLAYLFSKKKPFEILLSSIKWKTYIIIFAIFYFKYFIDTTGIANGMATELINMSISPLLIIILLPYLMGFMTGLTVAGVGLSFSLILGFSGNFSIISITLLGYMFAVSGVLTSPMHLCVVLTTEYFKSTYIKLLKKISVPLLLAIAAGLLVFLFIK